MLITDTNQQFCCPVSDTKSRSGRKVTDLTNNEGWFTINATLMTTVFTNNKNSSRPHNIKGIRLN